LISVGLKKGTIANFLTIVPIKLLYMIG